MLLSTRFSAFDISLHVCEKINPLNSNPLLEANSLILRFLLHTQFLNDSQSLTLSFAVTQLANPSPVMPSPCSRGAKQNETRHVSTAATLFGYFAYWVPSTIIVNIHYPWGGLLLMHIIWTHADLSPLLG